MLYLSDDARVLDITHPEEKEKEQLELKDFLSLGYPLCGYIYDSFDVLQKEAKVKEKKQRTAIQLPVVVETKGPAFKVYELRAENEHWYSTQDIYSSLVAKVPSLRISNTGLNQAPRISDLSQNHD